MSSSRFANLFILSSGLRCRGSTLQGIAQPTLYSTTLARGFRQNAVNHYQVVQQARPEPPKTDEEAMKTMEALEVVARRTGVDVWTQPIQVLDLSIPSWRSKRPNASIYDHLQSFRQAWVNAIRNAQTMYLIAKENGFPEVEVKSKWSTEIFKVKTSPWMAGLRRHALDVYSAANEAMATNDIKTVKKYAVGEYRDVLLKRIQAQDKNNLFVWKLHGENEPCQVLSIRSYQGHLGSVAPQHGHRLVIQALVKFDTNQSLQVFTKRGKLLAGDGKPKRVLEYLILQKRGWHDGPWMIRGQLYEGLENKFSPIT